MSTTVGVGKRPEGEAAHRGIGVFQVGELVRRNGWAVEEVTEEFEFDPEQARAALDYDDDHTELVETLRAQHRAGVRSLRDASRAE